MKAVLMRLVREESGQDLIEYALLAAFISLASFSSINSVGLGVSSVFDSVKARLDQVTH